MYVSKKIYINMYVSKKIYINMYVSKKIYINMYVSKKIYINTMTNKYNILYYMNQQEYFFVICATDNLKNAQIIYNKYKNEINIKMK
jgi:hypothetical protein